MRSRIETAAMTGGVVMAFGLLTHTVSMIGYVAGIPAEQLSMVLSGLSRTVLMSYLPFAVGVFASLWVIAPVVAGAQLARVATRATLAAGIGAVLAIVTHTVVLSSGAFSAVGSFTANSFPALPFASIANTLGIAVPTGITMFLQLLPLVMLVVILLWMRASRHPSAQPAMADLSEV